jgi:hypothetical protein
MGMEIRVVCMNSLTLKTKGEEVHTYYPNIDSLWKMLKGFNTSYSGLYLCGNNEHFILSLYL